MSDKRIRWLYSELPELIENNVIGRDGAERIREFYGEPEERNTLQIILVLCAVLGAVLIGLE